MLRGSLVTLVAAATFLGAADAAAAGDQILTFTAGPVTIEGYGVVTKPLPAPSPTVDGYVLEMSAEVVNAAGNAQGRESIMLHHVVFGKLGVPDYTCGGAAERFYAEGEERMRMALPPGYGYPNRATDRWYLLVMLMNHQKRALTGYVRYTVRYVTDQTLIPVRPIWLDVRNCTGLDPVFDVPGTGPRFSTFTKTWDYTMPESGRFVAGGGHLHGGGVRLELRNRSCGTTPFTSLPTWGPLHREPKPLLHQPGPAKMSSFRSAPGISVAAGDTVQLAAIYDNDRPHTRAMGIMLLYFVPGAVVPCEAASPLELDLGSPGAPPAFVMPLPRKPRGPVYRNLRGTYVGDYLYGHERISLERGATFTWRFLGATFHDVTVVSGPEGFSSPWTQSGTYRHRFTRGGTYNLFCSLHPTRMTQTITVR